MSESLDISLSGEEFESTPFNTTLFTFLGRAAINGLIIDLSTYNHIFFEQGEVDEETMSGAYMFPTETNQETFSAIAAHIVDNNYPMILNRREVPQCDIEARARFIEQLAGRESAEDFIPDDWLENGA